MRVALTFDTEPAPPQHARDNTRTILDALSARGATATFFIQAEWAEQQPELAARLVAQGHRVANHTYSHALPGAVSAEALVAEISRAGETIERLTGQDPKPYFRCPQNSGAFDAGVLDTIRSTGYRQVGWTFDSLDWRDRATAEEVETRVLAEIGAVGDGAVVLLHSWPDATAQALPGILDALIESGAEFVTLDALEFDSLPVATVAPKTTARTHRLGTSTAWGLVAKLFTVAANFLIGVIIARALGPVGKGGYALVQQIVGVLVVVLGLGLSTSNVYFVAHREVSPKEATANSLWLSLITGMIATVACYLLVAGPLAPDPPYSLAMAAVASALFVATTLFAWLGAIAVGMAGLRPQSIAGICSVITVLMGAWVLAQYGLLSALFMLALAVVGQTVASAVILWFGRGRMLSLRPSLTALKSMVTYSAKSYFVSLVGYLHLRQDVLLLGWLAGAAQVGIYSVAVSLAEVARYVPVVLGSALFARASQVGREEGATLSAGVSRLTVLLVLVTAAVFAVLGPIAVPLVFGGAFAGAGPVLLALLPGVAAMGISEVPSSYLFSREVIYWRTSAVMVTLNAALNVAVIPRFGIMGAAVVSSVTYGAYATVIIYLMKRESGLAYRDLLVPTARDFAAAWRAIRRYVAGA